MNDTAPLPPRRHDIDPMGQAVGFTGPSGRYEGAVGLFVAAFSLAAVIACVAGFGLGLLVMSASTGECSSGDIYCGLGAAALGIFVGTLVAVSAYVGVGVAMIRRHRPAGERTGQIAAHIAAAPAAVVLLAILSGGS